MVAAGVTACVPPVADMVNVLPSEPVTVTEVALVAATVRVEVPPAEMLLALGVMVTVGAVVVVPEAPKVEAPHPVKSSTRSESDISRIAGESRRENVRGRHTFVIKSLLSCG